MTSKQILGFLLFNTTISIIGSIFNYLIMDDELKNMGKGWTDFVVGFFGFMGLLLALELIVGLLALSIYLMIS